MAVKVPFDRLKEFNVNYGHCYYYQDGDSYYVFRDDDNFDDPLFGEDFIDDLSKVYLNQDH